MTRPLIPTLHTERFVLRAPKMADLQQFANFRAGPRSALVGGPFPAASAFTALCGIAGHWTLRGFGRFLVADRETDEALGIVGPFFPDDWPEPEIAWTVFDNAEGRGVAFEAAQAAIAFAYGTLGWTTAMSAISPENTRSLALARRLGARHDGEFIHPEYGPLQIWRHAAPKTQEPTA